MKKERGKAVEIYNSSNNDLFQDYSTSSELPCKKHPSSSSVGICAQCLKDRLLKLVCSDCGEQRLSSCSCSDEISSNRNSCSVEVGSVGRVSFLIENDNQKTELVNPKPKLSGCGSDKPQDVFLLKRSSSSCVEIKRKSGFWRIGKLFSKKREKGNSDQRSSVNGFEERNDLWVVDYMGVSRSRSLCSFRNGGFFGSEDGTFSGARSSISAARNSGLFDPDRKSGFSETYTEPRKSGFDPSSNVSDHESGFTRRIFSVKEGNFTTMDDESGFIDLKFDFPSESKSEMPATLYSNSAFGSMRSGGDFVIGGGGDQNGGSCRITVSDRGIKRSRKSFKSWRWIFRQNPNANKKDDLAA
ncbi:uncharacterized protein [Euphorbia lathyris]|uniref:uncharacterized protein n=1 Tax=Euphorbia lathyris TaxID=212925 RepID=UPI00331379DD